MSAGIQLGEDVVGDLDVEDLAALQDRGLTLADAVTVATALTNSEQVLARANGEEPEPEPIRRAEDLEGRP